MHMLDEVGTAFNVESLTPKNNAYLLAILLICDITQQ